MDKLTTDFVVLQYQTAIENYSAFTTEVGLWASERYAFEKHLKKTDKILDIGCGTGRTTFHLFRLGYQQITGIDFTPEMIAEAKALNESYQLNVVFKEGDARNLEYKDREFDAVIFSFNGMMFIPDSTHRKKALDEINRVLKGEGIFIFTTHDREKDANYFEFWKEQKRIWNEGQQDPKLYEFGDIITNSKNEERAIYIHIPNKEEIENFLEEGGFDVIETFYRSDKFEESEKVKAKSGECRFWITRKRK